MMTSKTTPNIELYKVCDIKNGQLFIMPKPNGDDLKACMQFYRENGVTKVVSLLLPEEHKALNLENEAEACISETLEFSHFPVKDMSTPEANQLKRLLKELKNNLENGAGISVHCHGGRGRAGTLVTILMIEHGYSPQEAIEIASKARGDKVPVNDLQKEFVLNWK
jgi:protein-tyrosine phosphatase